MLVEAAVEEFLEPAVMSGHLGTETGEPPREPADIFQRGYAALPDGFEGVLDQVAGQGIQQTLQGFMELQFCGAEGKASEVFR